MPFGKEPSCTCEVLGMVIYIPTFIYITIFSSSYALVQIPYFALLQLLSSVLCIPTVQLNYLFRRLILTAWYTESQWPNDNLEHRWHIESERTVAEDKHRRDGDVSEATGQKLK